MAHAYAAGAAGMPSAFFSGYIGSDLPHVNPRIKSIECPFTGEALAAVPALRPDVAVIHAQRADREGNVLIAGIIGVQKEAVLAARQSDRDGRGGGRRPRLDRHECDGAAVVDDRRDRVVPGGARPSYAHGYYARDNAFYTAWDEISRDRDRFLRWVDDEIRRPDGRAPETARA